jgi:adenylosuccinate synthase
MSKQEIKIVLGLMFGDEGKGNTTQYLCQQAINLNILMR